MLNWLIFIAGLVLGGWIFIHFGIKRQSYLGFCFGILIMIFGLAALCIQTGFLGA